MKPKISVIIATYYRNELVQDAIESVLEQEYEPLELIVVDDSGEGNAEPVLEQYDDLTAIVREENGGWAAAYTDGLEASTGEYVQFLDDDDYLLEGKLAKTAEVLEENPDVGVSYCGMVQDTDGRHPPKKEVRGDILENALRFRTFPLCTITMLMERDVLESTLPLAKYADDPDLKIELARRTNFEFVDECLVYRRKEESRKWEGLSKVQEIKSVVENQHEMYDRFPAVRRALLAETYEEEGKYRLERRLWSAAAVACFAKAAYYANREKPRHLAGLVASLFGRPGYSAAQTVNRRMT